MTKLNTKVQIAIGTCLSALILFYTYTQKADFLKQAYAYYFLGITVVSTILIFLLHLFKITLPEKIEKVFRCILFLLAPLISVICIEYLNGNFLWDIKEALLNSAMNYLLALLFYFVVYALSGSSKLSIKLVTPFLYIFGVVNYFVKLYKGAPFLPYDITSIGTAAAVSNTYPFTITHEIIFTFSLVVLLYSCANLIEKVKQNRIQITLRCICLSIVICFLAFFYGTNLPATELGISPDFFNQTRGYENYGALAEFLVNARYLTLNAPEQYDLETLDQECTDNISSSQTITQTALENNGYEYSEAEKVENPNVVVIMNESFSDLSVIGNFDTNQEVLPFINSLKEDDNTIEGNVYVSTFGTGTSNTEYEFLTGNSMAFLPPGSNAYQLYVDHTQPSLVSSLKDTGYSADVLHPYYRDDWNRPSVYEDMGFDSFLGLEDIYGYTLCRNYVSDEWDFKKVEDMYEERDTRKPFFLFNITMQNHPSYEKEYSNFTKEISLENMDGEYPLTETYLSLIHQTDKDFEQLINYFSNQEEPTIVLMFGDHQPFIEDAFYENVMGSSISNLDDATNQNRYITRFIMWANYDIPSGWVDTISANYLSTLLCENANIPLTTYQKYLQNLYQEIPVVSQLGCLDWNKQYFKVEEDTPYRNDLLTYHHLAYNNLVEDEKRKNELFYIAD